MRDEDGRDEILFYFLLCFLYGKMFEGNKKKNNKIFPFAKISEKYIEKFFFFLLINRIGCCTRTTKVCLFCPCARFSKFHYSLSLCRSSIQHSCEVSDVVFLQINNTLTHSGFSLADDTLLLI